MSPGRSAGASDPAAAPGPFPWWLVGATLLVYGVALLKPLAIDEESYRWLGRVVTWEDPYGWMRTWQGQQGWLYAHPPLFLWWAKLLSTLESLPLARLASLPWVLLWAGSSALWMRRTTHHPEVAGVAWLGSAIVVLGLQDSLMIDLPYVALSTAAVAFYREGLSDTRVPWTLLGGVALGAAIETKYPAALFALVLLLHGWRRGHPLAFWAPAAAMVGGVEGWLRTEHGEWHLAAVWRSRELVARGPLAGRLLGVLSRGALLPATAGLLYFRPVHAAIGLALAIGALVWARPVEIEAGGVVFLLLCASLGGAALSRGLDGLFQSPLRRRKGDRDDGILLGGMIAATFVGVILVHNYASARYLLPAATPLAIVLARSAEDLTSGKRVQLVVSGVGAVVAAGLAIADWQFCAAGEEAAERGLAAAAAREVPPGLFAAEWSARATLEAAGWKRMVDTDTPEVGSTVLVLGNSGGKVPASWEPIQVEEVEGGFPLRVVDVRGRVGLYAETLGVLPFGLSGRPLETAVLYEVRR